MHLPVDSLPGERQSTFYIEHYLMSEDRSRAFECSLSTKGEHHPLWICRRCEHCQLPIIYFGPRGYQKQGTGNGTQDVPEHLDLSSSKTRQMCSDRPRRVG